MIDLGALRHQLDVAAHDAGDDQLDDLAGVLEAVKVGVVARRLAPRTTDTAALVDAAEMARILCVPENWVRDKARAGALPHHQLGHYVRFAPAEVIDAARRVSKSHDRQSRTVEIPKQNQRPNRAGVQG